MALRTRLTFAIASTTGGIIGFLVIQWVSDYRVVSSSSEQSRDRDRERANWPWNRDETAMFRKAATDLSDIVFTAIEEMGASAGVVVLASCVECTC